MHNVAEREIAKDNPEPVNGYIYIDFYFMEVQNEFKSIPTKSRKYE